MTQSDERLGPALRPRTAARVAAVQALFQIEQGDDRPEPVIVQFVRHRFGITLSGESFEDGHIPEADATLFTGLVRGAAASRKRAETLLTETLPPTWPVGRLDPVLRALFTVAIAEMESPDAPPVKIIINEYLDVAHGFFSGDEPKLVNGVLDTIAKRLKNPVPAGEASAHENGRAIAEKLPEADAADDGQV
ncbi:transcription antitermination factor NusB [Acetobacter oeni]|uniref:Transcription antitermination protein NusB n=1 Tax=Acetobacter oeni TaxID=304077 RepID=A0A511XJ77_9PROT|nr:transcription antitermination factor NusB [Acetobacter oeni]MBB3882811.1 N utilization substance protein B [Acetobacter oeni]NHO18900.1 transcription antitermination factor NusB [Acetobacter oeni]GBR09603.1 transcription antitermination factor NusB [Acetobacter oeni LMG 21952]GEN63003.1 N utilization substance protein B [Acetobacter oeni]